VSRGPLIEVEAGGVRKSGQQEIEKPPVTKPAEQKREAGRDREWRRSHC